MTMTIKTFLKCIFCGLNKVGVYMNFNGRQSDVLGTRTTFPAFVFHYCFAPSEDRKRKKKNLWRDAARILI